MAKKSGGVAPLNPASAPKSFSAGKHAVKKTPLPKIPVVG